MDESLNNLVFKNYKNFITAADKLKDVLIIFCFNLEMRTEIDSMDDEVDKLKESMDKIGSSTNLISNHLSEKRERIEKVSGVYDLLGKLNYLADIPAQLNEGLENDDFEACLPIYGKAKNILQKYAHVPTFARIYDESQVLAKKAISRLWIKFLNFDVLILTISEQF